MEKNKTKNESQHLNDERQEWECRVKEGSRHDGVITRMIDFRDNIRFIAIC